MNTDELEKIKADLQKEFDIATGYFPCDIGGFVETVFTRAFQLGVEASEKCVAKEYPEFGYKDSPFHGTVAARNFASAFNACRTQTLANFAQLKEPFTKDK